MAVMPLSTSAATSVSASRRCNSCLLASYFVSAAWISPPDELANIASSSVAM
jgi:hypothetical protein